MRFTTEEWGWSRRNACRVLTLLIMACGIPVSLSFGPWADYTRLARPCSIRWITSPPT